MALKGKQREWFGLVRCSDAQRSQEQARKSTKSNGDPGAIRRELRLAICIAPRYCESAWLRQALGIA